MPDPDRGTNRAPGDEELVARLRAGDEAAFGTMLDAWSGSMHRLATSYLRSSASADEVVQETWVAVIENIAGFEGRSSLKHWVYRILVNTAKRRALRESRTVPVGDPLETSVPAVAASSFRGRRDAFPGHWRDLPASWPTPEEASESAEVREVVAEAVRRLPPRQAAAVTLRDIEGHDAEEAAALLGVTAANQRVLLHRGRAAVRAALEEYFLSGVTDGAARDSGQS
ncbi:MAG TPA: RNA polymerase sigma factor [Intrasporangium sp.]|nr:RNA polymerase sigma factor [Intrasporangium sp.]